MVTAAMATAAVSPFASLLCSKCRKEIVSSSSSLVVDNPRSSRSQLYTLKPRLGSASFSAWSGLKQLGCISFERIERRGKCKGRMVIRASLFGVGAPEALVIGVVALLVFGPKGLAEVARTLGKTLRAFQPTIRELQDVSREFKSTIENEIGLDEVGFSSKNTYTPSTLANQELSTSANYSIMEAVLPPTSSEVSATSDSPISISGVDATTESPAVALTPIVSEATDTNASQKASREVH